ncbi:MAG: ion transporter [Bacteroidota bacterium]
MIRQKIKNYFESDGFQKTIVTIIIINSVLIGLETSDSVMSTVGFYIDSFDLVILVLFSLEIILKVYAYRMSFFRDPWNLFDLSIVLISIMPAAGSFSVFRALRIVRTLRLLKNIRKLRVIIESLLQSIPSIGWIGVLLFIIYYTFAVIGTNLYGAAYPDYFGSLGRTFFTLFQIMTLESWASAVARPIMDGMPFAPIYFVTFILIATYTTLNVFIAIVVNTMNEVSIKGIKEEEQHIKDLVIDEHEKMHAKLDALEKRIDQLLEQKNHERKEVDIPEENDEHILV